MKALGILLTAIVALLAGGCPTTSTPTGDTTPVAWLDGQWVATASSGDQTVTGCLTISGNRVTVWGHGCSGETMPVLDNPLAAVTGSTAVVTVTVVPPGGQAMMINMRVTKASDDLLRGSITTFSVGVQSFVGTVTLTRQ